MSKETFIEDFISYFNENIKHENSRINNDYNLERAKLMIVLTDSSKNEIKRAYKFVVNELFAQNLSLDYITPEMVRFEQEPNMAKRKDKRLTLVISPVTSRKPLKATAKVLDELNTEKGLNDYKNILVSHYNKCYQAHKNKVNTYDTFEFVMNHSALSDKDSFKDKFAEEVKSLEGYKVNQLKFDLLNIEKLDNQQYLVRYNYGE